MADEALDWVQYAIYSDACTGLAAPLAHAAAEAHLNELRVDVFERLQLLLQGYIWQHDPFKLDIMTTPSGLTYLGGTTRFGDNIEDEWFIAYLLFTVSQKVSGVSITVRDNDGEFLLIEAAYVIPRWVEPENSENRVFLRDGCVHLIGPARKSPKAKLGPLTVEEAVGLMKDGKSVTKAGEKVQEVVARRIKGYPKQARENMHKARCVVPLSVACVLKHEPQMVSLAVEAFYRRDIDAMKAASKLNKFLPMQDGGAEKEGEMIEVLVTFSRAMYAQLQQQVFAAPRKYPMPPVADRHYKEAELGMKLTCGFEMMYWEHKKFESKDGSTTESGENTNEDKAPVSDPGWQVYRKSLENRGYFRDLLEGSKEYTQLLQAAVKDYQAMQSFASTSAAMQAPIKRINDILSSPHTGADFPGLSLPESDNDSWLYDGEADLTSAMNERHAEMEAHELMRATQKPSNKGTGEQNGVGQQGGNISEPLYDPEELVQGIQAFMSKTSSYEGAELPDDGAVPLDVSKLMQELVSALGTHRNDSGSRADFMAKDFDDTESDMESDDSDEDEDDDGSRASSSMGKPVDIKKKSTSEPRTSFMDEYSDALQHELLQTSLAKSFATSEDKDEPAKTSSLSQEDDKDKESHIVDVDLNLVQSLLQSYMNQEGMPGPASNLLGSMGIKLSAPTEKTPGRGK